MRFCGGNSNRFDGVNPSPDIMELIGTGSGANAPTISHSGRCLENPNEFDGNF